MKSTFLQKVERYKRGRGTNPTLATPAFKDLDPPTLKDYAAISPVSIGKDVGPSFSLPVLKRKPKL